MNNNIIWKKYTMDLSFVILTWNSESYIEKCLQSCVTKCDQENLKIELLVVDNGSTDNTINIVENLADRLSVPIKLTKLKENKGTTISRNLALRQAQGEFICILDSDTEFGKGSIIGALEFIDENANVGILAPRLILPNGSIQNSIKKFPSFFQKLKKIPKALVKAKVTEHDFYSDLETMGISKIHSAISACWFFQKNLLSTIGYLDENIFYSPEDLDYCIRVYNSGRQNFYFPELEVLHHTQQISHSRPFSRVSISHFGGLLYYYRKHGGWLFPPET